MKSQAEYQQERQQLHDKRLQALERLLEQQPKLKNKELAELLSYSESTIKRMKSELKSRS